MSNPNNIVKDRNGAEFRAGDRVVIEVAGRYVTCPVIDVVPATTDGWAATATLLLPDGQKFLVNANGCYRVRREVKQRVIA